MKELKDLIDYMVGYGEAIATAVDKFATSLPVYTKQQLNVFAGRKLNSTKEHYLEKTTVKLDSYVLIVEIDRDDWLANALENGVSSFDMKPGLLKSPKAKRSSKGFRYIRVPIGKEKDRNPGPSAKGQDLQNRINQVLKKPQFGPKSVPKISITGGVYESQKIINSDPKLQGFYRTRKFESIQEYHSGKKPKWGYTLFRTVSENPTAMSKWQHPGFEAANILKELERWIVTEAPNLLDYFIEQELEEYNRNR